MPPFSPKTSVALLVLSLLAAACAFEFEPEPIPPAFPSDLGQLPISGFEVEFDPNLWNDGGLVQFSTNCYAYALNQPFGHPAGHKLQPGELSGSPLSSASDVDVTRIIELTRADAQFAGFTFSEVEPETPCGSGTYKVALVVDPAVDYHWYRQNPDGTWSGKSGHTEATNLDASGNVIDDPRTANRDYGFINYTEFGGVFCVSSSSAN